METRPGCAIACDQVIKTTFEMQITSGGQHPAQHQIQWAKNTRSIMGGMAKSLMQEEKALGCFFSFNSKHSVSKLQTYKIDRTQRFKHCTG